MDSLTDKEKVEILEKEANLILKELAFILTIIGSLLLFFINHLDFSNMLGKISKMSQAEIFSILQFVLYFFLIIWATIGFYIADEAKRFLKIKREIQRINNAILKR